MNYNLGAVSQDGGIPVDGIARNLDRERWDEIVKGILFGFVKGHGEEMVSMNAKNKKYPLIPEEERKCVWMTTGLISYKLCERNYQCEFCPFDQAIKNEESGEGNFQEAEGDWTEGSFKMDPSARIKGSIFYHPDHCWVKVENPEKVKIGIDDLIAQLMTNVKVVILPRVGSFIGQGECCAHIIQEDYILPVISPLSGSIQAVNPRLKKKPELMTDDSERRGLADNDKTGKS